MPSEERQGAGALAALALVLLLGRAHVDGAEDRRRHKHDRDGSDEPRRCGGAGKVLARDPDEREQERPEGENPPADVERVHVRKATEARRTAAPGEERSPIASGRTRGPWRGAQ